MGIQWQEPQLTITPKILQFIAEIDEFKGRWEALGQLEPDRLQVLRKVATIESVGSSTRIEGAKLSDAEVEQLLSGIQIRSFQSRDEQEVGGYAETMELVFNSFKEIELTENHIKQLHQTLLRYSTKDTRHRGEYKKLPNSVEAFDAQGKSLGVIFETATPFETPLLMEQLIIWTQQVLADDVHHPLLIIAVFTVYFLAIHPFQDGNGRLSRILTTLLLLQHGYDYVPFSSLEHIIEDNKNQYYLSLRRAQSTLSTDQSQLNDWILFCLQCLKRQKEVLAGKIAQERIIQKLPELSEQILRLAYEHGRVTNLAIQQVTGANRNTIKVHLQKLVRQGRLKRQGRGKGIWYQVI
jgi:Fic family protein